MSILEKLMIVLAIKPRVSEFFVARRLPSPTRAAFTIDASNDGGHWSDKGIISPVNPGA